MKSAFLAVAMLLAAVVGAPQQASAQDWWEKVISESKRSAAAVDRASERSSRASRSESRRAAADNDGERRQKSSARTRTARASSDDDSSSSSSNRRSRDRDTGSGGEVGVASYYWQPQPLASGGRFDPNAWTAAHKSLPFGTRVRVTRLDNGNNVDVTINDRGPYISGRIIDLSRRAAQAIDMTGQGIARVRVSIIGRG